MQYTSNSSSESIHKFDPQVCQVSWLGIPVLFFMLAVSWREDIGLDKDAPPFHSFIIAYGRHDAKRELRSFSTFLLQQNMTNMKTARNMLAKSGIYQ